MRTASFALCFLALSASAAAARDCYAPTPEETARYQAIAKRLAGEETSGALKSVSQQELQWALQLEQRVTSQGYRPTEQEIATYTDIARRLEASPVAAPSSAATGAEGSARDFTAWSAPARTPAPPRVSEQDMDWAQDLAARVKRGENPSREELRRYEDVYRRVQASLAARQPPPPSPPPPTARPSAKDLRWALALEARVKRGKNLTDEETSRYQDIIQRLKASEVAGTAEAPASLPAVREPATPIEPVSEAELAWAVALQTRAESGGEISEAEKVRYGDIFRRYTSPPEPTPPPPPPVYPQPYPPYPPPPQPTWNVFGANEADIQWALDLERKVKGPCPAP